MKTVFYALCGILYGTIVVAGEFSMAGGTSEAPLEQHEVVTNTVGRPDALIFIPPEGIKMIKDDRSYTGDTLSVHMENGKPAGLVFTPHQFSQQLATIRFRIRKGALLLM